MKRFFFKLLVLLFRSRLWEPVIYFIASCLPNERKVDIVETNPNLFLKIFRLSLKGKSFKKSVMKRASYYHNGVFLFSVDLNILEYTQARYYQAFPDPPLRNLILEGGDTFLDIGANIGIFSMLASCFFKRVLSFEVLPSALASLKRNTSKMENVFVNDFGLSSSSGEIVFYQNGDGDGGSSLVKENVKNIKGEIIVKVRPLDSVDIDNSITLVKIDVEGHELDVLKGARSTFGKYTPKVFMETHSDDILAGLKEVLPSGYRLKNPYTNAEGLGFPDTLIYWN